MHDSLTLEFYNKRPALSKMFKLCSNRSNHCKLWNYQVKTRGIRDHLNTKRYNVHDPEIKQRFTRKMETFENTEG